MQHLAAVSTGEAGCCCTRPRAIAAAAAAAANLLLLLLHSPRARVHAPDSGVALAKLLR
jgi:hypothetical protein